MFVSVVGGVEVSVASFIGAGVSRGEAFESEGAAVDTVVDAVADTGVGEETGAANSGKSAGGGNFWKNRINRGGSDFANWTCF